MSYTTIQQSDLDEVQFVQVPNTVTAKQLKLYAKSTAANALALKSLVSTVTGNTDELLSQISALQTLTSSDNLDLNSVQELVDAIETVQTSLSTILVNDLTTGGTTKALTAEQGKTLKGLIDTLNSNVSSLQSFQTSTTSTLSTLDDEITSLQGFQSTATSHLSTLDGEISDLQSSVNTITSNISSTDIGTLASSVSTLNGQNLDSRISTLEGASNDITDLANSVTALQTLTASDNANLNTVQELVDAIETIQTFQSSTTTTISNLTTADTALDARIDTLEGKIVVYDYTEIVNNSTINVNISDTVKFWYRGKTSASISLNITNPIMHQTGGISDEQGNFFPSYTAEYLTSDIFMTFENRYHQVMTFDKDIYIMHNGSLILYTMDINDDFALKYSASDKKFIIS